MYQEWLDHSRKEILLESDFEIGENPFRVLPRGTFDINEIVANVRLKSP
jgi:hypothetical protein